MKKFLFFMMIFLWQVARPALGVEIKNNFAEENDFYEKTFIEKTVQILEYGKKIDEKFLGDKIEEPFIDDIRQDFGISTQEAQNLESKIRFGVRAYRFGKEKYEQIKAKILTPEPKVANISQADYEKAMQEEEYVPSDDLVVQDNFLRFIPYSHEKKHFKAFEKKHYENLKKMEPETEIDVLRQQIANLEVKKLLEYGYTEPNPFTANIGQGVWSNEKNVGARIISAQTKIGDNKEIIGAIHFDIKAGFGIKYKPIITFENSSNLESAEVLYPAPSAFVSDEKIVEGYYFGNFAISVILKPQDINKDMDIKTQIKMELCTPEKCEPKDIAASLVLKAGKAFNSASSVFVNQALNTLPIENYKNRVKDVFVTQDGEVEVIFNADYNKKNTSLFITNFLTQPPLIKINDDGFSATFKPMTKLEDKNVEIIATTNALSYGIYQKEIKQKPVGTLFKSFKTGVMINFYPWILALILGVLYSFSSKEQEIKKQALYYATNTIGWSIAGIIIAKFLPYWGVQLQNAYYLIVTTFLICLLLAYRMEWWSYNFIKLRFFYGAIIVALFGLATNEVLFEEPNWALLTLGFILPYIIIFLFPVLIKKLPKPGEVLSMTNKLINIGLLITILWLIITLGSWSMLLIVTIALGLLWLNHKTKEFIEANYKNPLTELNRLKFLIGALIFMCFMIAMSFIKLLAQPDTIPQISEQNSLIKIQPNWCMVCKINEAVGLKSQALQTNKQNLAIINLPYNIYTKKYMQKFGYYQPPFYILFSTQTHNGLILPQFVGEKEVNDYII